MIYFVNTIFLRNETYFYPDENSEEYKNEEARIEELNRKAEEDAEKNLEEFKKQYAEFFSYLEDENKEEEFHRKYGTEEDWHFNDLTEQMIDANKKLEFELRKDYDCPTIRGNWADYCCYTFEGKRPSREEYCKAVEGCRFVIQENYSSRDLSKVPVIEEEVYVLEQCRTPIMFTNLDDAKEFVETNSCDWEECGYYNFADIQCVKESCYCPNPGKKEETTHIFYSTEDGWIESGIAEFDQWFTCTVNGKKILKLTEGEDSKPEYESYTGLVDIG